MNRAFQKLMGDIKRQKETEQKKEQKLKQRKGNNRDEEQELSSDEEKKLKQLGVFKKKIFKEQGKGQQQWRHDKYTEDRLSEKLKPCKELRAPTIIFQGRPGYSRIFPIIKHLKIYVREIDDKSIVFNEIHAFVSAKKLFVKNGLVFKTLQFDAME